MRNRGKGIAAILSAAMIMSATLAFAAETSSGEISEGMFAWLIVQAYNAACSINGGTENLWKNGIEGETTEDWILATAKAYAQEYLAVEQEFDDEGLSLRSSELETIESTKETYWNAIGYGRYYEEYGITEDDFEDVLTHEYKISILYEEASGELEEAVTDEDVYSYIEENANLVQYIAVPYSDTLEEDATEDEINAWVDTDVIYEEYKERLEEGESMEDLVVEVSENEEQAALGISSSYVDGIEETLFLNGTTALSSGFKAALAEAEPDTVVYFDDAAQYYQIIFVKKEFTEDWDGLDSCYDTIVALVAEEQFEANMASWGETCTLSNEDDLPSAADIKEMFS